MTLNPRTDQVTDPPAAVLAPGGSAGVFKGRLVVIFGTGSTGATGLFVYSPTPGKNNLVYSIVAAAGHDSYGNTVFAGASSYVHLAPTYYAIAVAAGSGITPAITYYQSPGDQTSVYTIMFALSAYTNAGGSPGLSLADVPSAVPPNAWDGPLVALSPANIAETWHLLTPAAGWANNGGAEPSLSYRLTVLGDVELLGHVNGTIAGSTTIGTLPANYFSGSVSYTVPLVVSSSAGVTAGQTPRLSLTAGSGALVVKGLSNGAATVELDGIVIPLSNG
jgi:hypothetical protein